MTLPYASMEDDNNTTDNKKPTAIALWRQWRPNKVVSGLRPRLNRRRKRPSTAFPSTEEPKSREAENDVPAAAESQQDNEEPTSPPTTSHVDIEPEEITTPRTEQRATFDSTFSLTPPTRSPAPLVVSAKRLGSEVRRNHSKRRKGRLWNNKENSSFNVTSWRAENEMDDGDEKEEGLPPVEHLSPAERTQRYWQWCYGNSTEPMPQSSWSASRAPPEKSCLSHTKEPPMVRAVTIETPTLDRIANDNAETVELSIPSTAFETPSNTPPDAVIKKKSASSKTVQFGMASAAEYELDCPPKELTPMPSEVAKERFPLTESVESEATEETKHNSATLAEWDNDFDSYLDSDDDDDESSSGEELESMLFSRKRNSRRNSGFFSPSSLLLPEETDDMQGSDLSPDVDMASLAVQSPIYEGIGTKTGKVGQAKRLDLEPQSGSMETTPPSEIQLGAVNSTGGALAEANPRDATIRIPSRQLHGALERCAEDENDIVMMLTENPNLELEWPTEQLLRTMARHSSVNESSKDLVGSEGNSLLELLASIALPCSIVQNHVSKEVDWCVSQTPRDFQGTLRQLSSDDTAKLTEWERQKFEFSSLERLLQRMRDLETSIKSESEIMEKRCMMQSLAMVLQSEKDKEEVTGLEDRVKTELAERDMAVARLRQQEAIRDLMRQAPHNVVCCLALCNIASFTVESVSPSTVDVSFSCSVELPRPGLRWDEQKGIGSFVMKQPSLVAERAPAIPSESVAACFYNKLLFVDGLDDDLAIHPLILRHVVATNDISQCILSLSLLMGRLDRALVDLSNVTCKSYVGKVSVERLDETLLLVSVFFHDDMKVHFYYDQRSEKSLTHVIPSRVRVVHGGIRKESLEAEAMQMIGDASGSDRCLERICDAFFLATCL